MSALFLRRSAFVGIAIITSSLANSTQISWKPIGESNGVILYQRNDPGMDLLSIKGETVVKSSLNNILEVLKDNERAKEWMPYIGEKRDIEYSGENERIEYTQVDMPWPMTDRFFVNYGRLDWQDNGSLVISVESVDRPDIVDEDRIRGWIHYSNFTLIPEGTNATRMIVEVNTDPKGWLPNWIINIAQKQWPKEFFAGLNEELTYKGLLQEPGSSEKITASAH